MKIEKTCKCIKDFTIDKYVFHKGREYQVDIYGTNLSSCTYSSYNHAAGINFDVHKLTGSGNTHTALIITIPTSTDQLEVIIDGVSKCTITKEVFRKIS